MDDTARQACPFCGEQIVVDALKCRFCGEWLKPTDSGSAAAPRPDGPAGYDGPGASSKRQGRLFKKEPWALLPDEKVLAQSEPFRRREIATWLILGIPSLGFGFLWGGGIWVYYRLMRVEWILTDRRVILAAGWLTRRAKSVSLDKVNEVNYARRLDERVLWSTGTVTIESAATAGVTEMRRSADSDPFRHALEAQVEQRRARTPTDRAVVL